MVLAGSEEPEDTPDGRWKYEVGALPESREKMLGVAGALRGLERLKCLWDGTARGLASVAEGVRMAAVDRLTSLRERGRAVLRAPGIAAVSMAGLAAMVS